MDGIVDEDQFRYPRHAGQFGCLGWGGVATILAGGLTDEHLGHRSTPKSPHHDLGRDGGLHKGRDQQEGSDEEDKDLGKISRSR